MAFRVRPMKRARNERVLALALRPQALEVLVGQEALVRVLGNQFASGRLPHFFVVAGPSGCGKTTLALILAAKIGGHLDEMNAANTNGVDDIRKLVSSMQYRPLPPCRHRIVLLDEAHQLTTPAQNVLLTEVEDVPSHAFYIFCTTTPGKLLPALRRRAFLLSPQPLGGADVRLLLESAATSARCDRDLEPLALELEAADIAAPGLVLQAAEQYFAGAGPAASIAPGAEAETEGELCRALVHGDWKGCRTQLSKLKRGSEVGARLSVTGYMKAVLLRSELQRAAQLARAISRFGTLSDTSPAAFAAAVCLACTELRPQL